MEKDIGKIKKNDTTDVVVRIDDFGGKVGLTIREYVTSERYTGFTKAGTRIPAENFDEFRALINSINPEDLSGAIKAETPETSQATEAKPKRARKKAAPVVEKIEAQKEVEDY